MKNLFVFTMLAISMNMLTGPKSWGYLVSEVEPGIVEIRGAQRGGMVSSQIHVDKKKQWLYMEVKEGSESRYFYAPYRDFSKLAAGKKKLQAVQFGIGHRIFNTKGRIPFGSQKYFYPLVDFRSAT